MSSQNHRNMRRIGLLISVLFTSTIFAQDILTSLEDSLSLEQVVITSSRSSTNDPVTFINVSKKEIEKINLGQDPVVLIQALSPSIVTYSDGGTDIGNYSQLRMRGIDQSRINMTLNGVPLNDMADHGTYFSNFSDFGKSIQSIQIQRGAGSGQRGTASYGGAINFESINIFGDNTNGEAQLTFGSFGTLRTAAELSTGKNSNGLGFYGRMTRTETGGYKYNSGSDSYSLFFSGGKLRDKDMFKITAFTGKTQNGQSYLHVPLNAIERDPRTNNNDINDIDDFEQNMVQLQYAKYANDNTTFDVTAYYNSAGGVFPFSFGGDQFMFALENDHFGAMANVTKQHSNGTWNIGAHTYVFDRINYEYITPLVTEPYTRDFTDKKEFSAYTKYTIDLEKFSLYANAEIRALSMNIKGDPTFGPGEDIDNSWTFINGVIGASFKMDSNNSAYVSLAHTNREPTRSDILNGVENSESVLDLELGWKYSSKLFKMEANLFSMTFNDEISNIGALEALSYMEIRQNVDRSSRYGVETSFWYTPNSNWNAALNLTWMDSNIREYDNGSRVFTNVKHVFASNWIVQPMVSYAFAENSSFSLTGRYVSESFSELSNNEEFILSSHFILNAQLDLFIAERIGASLMLNNIFDNLYFTEGGPIDSDFDGVVEGMGYRIQPPRHFYIMLKYKL